MDHAPRLDRPGPFELLLAHKPGGDRLILNLHHAAGDATAGMRLLTSVLRAYDDAADPVPPFDPLAAREVHALLGAKSFTDRRRRVKEFGRIARLRMCSPVRIARRGQSSANGYGFRLLSLDASTCARVFDRRPPRTTVNDVLLGAFALTIRRWNDAHGAPRGRVALTMPINGRPPQWRHEVLGNFSIHGSVSMRGAALVDLPSAVRAAARRTAQIKQDCTVGLMVELLAGMSRLPIGIKRWMIRRKPIVGDRILDTAVMTNLGRTPAFADPAGDAGAVTGFWFSSPNHMPMGTSLGAVSLGAEMFLCLCYRHTQFDEAAAAEFSALFEQTLLASDSGLGHSPGGGRHRPARDRGRFDPTPSYLRRM